jgi:hypothetical protein
VAGDILAVPFDDDDIADDQDALALDRPVNPHADLDRAVWKAH